MKVLPCHFHNFLKSEKTKAWKSNGGKEWIYLFFAAKRSRLASWNVCKAQKTFRETFPFPPPSPCLPTKGRRMSEYIRYDIIYSQYFMMSYLWHHNILTIFYGVILLTRYDVIYMNYIIWLQSYVWHHSDIWHHLCIRLPLLPTPSNTDCGGTNLTDKNRCGPTFLKSDFNLQMRLLVERRSCSNPKKHFKDYSADFRCEKWPPHSYPT
jgi:hypothetical protein